VVSKVKIFQNVVCKKLMTYPVQHNNVILDLDKQKTITDCGERILAVTNCDIAVGTTFCKTLETSTCA